MSNKALYRQVCASQPDISVFARGWWLDVVCADWDAAIAVKGDRTLGVWAYPTEQKLGVTLMRTPKLTPYAGPQVFYPADMKPANRDSFEHEVITALMAQLPKAQFWDLAVQPGVHQAGIFQQNGLVPQVRQTFLIDLQQDAKLLLANMKESVRRNIKAAEGVIAIRNAPECLDKLYEYHQHTLGKKGKQLPYTLIDLQKIMDATMQHSASALWVAETADGVQAIIWEVWDGYCSYYFMGGQNPAVQGSKAMTALLWHCIKTAQQRNNKIFDFEGSMDVGVERFFRGFGGTRSLFMILMRNTSPVWKLKRNLLG